MEKLDRLCTMIVDKTKNRIVLKLTDDIKVLKNELVLCDSELNEYNALSAEKRKREFLGVRLAFKKLLGKDNRITYDENGKPGFIDNSYQISVSHSKNWIAVIVDQYQKVGIDIEEPNEKIRKIYKRFLSIQEQEDLSAAEDMQKILIAWSAKESLYKIIGNQAVDFANQLRIFPFDRKSEGTLKAEHIPTKKIFQLSYFQNSAYTLVWCIDSTN